MDLRQLEILQAIAETGSFTACGRKLHVSQSAISRQVLLLEEELGDLLFQVVFYARIAEELKVSPETARTHAKRSMQKTDTHRQAELVSLVLSE